MIQLKLFKLPDDPDSAIYIDLYDTEPIKLTLSIEDITNAEASSIFSRTFKVPATRHNNEFFTNAFEIDGIDYDVTVKRKAEILVDGAEFRQGQVRLQRIYVNGDQDKIDYELLFLGETRDFSSELADKTMCQIAMTDFNWPELPQNYTNANDFIGPYGFNDIVGSWNAYPESPNLVSGTADGDLLFPLIDHGNTYDDNGNPLQGRIALGSTGSGSFTHAANSLDLTRLKPMIRAKRIWDQIFEDAGYTYSSDFLNSPLFHQMYISAFGNNEQVGMEVGQTTTTVFESSSQFGQNNDVGLFMWNNQVVGNVSGDYNIASPTTGSYFICPGTASVGGNFYIMSAAAQVDASNEQSNGPNEPLGSAVQLGVVDNIGGNITQILATGNYTFNGQTSSVTWDSRNGGYQPVAGQIIQVFINPDAPYVDYSNVTSTYWDCTAAPGDYYSPLDLDCQYKQIDYIKDILTMFRLVMQPDNNRVNNFIIEPWQEFIGSGETYDWSDKLVQNKDVILEPLFNTQSQEIEFAFAEDEDYINQFHQDNNKHSYGWLRFNSNNELLKGKRDVKVNGIAPTPIDQIETAANGAHAFPQWILPVIHTHDDNTAANEHVPIKPKTRILFYNGLQDITVQQDKWYLDIDDGSPSIVPYWPLVSPYSDWPVQQTSINLNFSNDTRYYINPYPGPGYYEQGSTLFDEYWSRYISSLYNKFSRRLTAYFTLNNVDLQDFSFNDIIFVNGKYYRPEKINDVQIGETTEVKVQLITLKDQRPIWLPEPLDGFSVITYNTSCIGAGGSIQITTNGTPNFTWQLDSGGSSGTFNAPVDQAPYTFIIDAPVGQDTLIVTDSLGRNATVQVSVPQSTSTEVTSTFTSSNPNVCANDEGACNGSIQVLAAGGAGAPYTIQWFDSNLAPDTFSRSGLCEGSYEYEVFDVNGCSNTVQQVVLECEDLTSNYQVQLLSADGQCDLVGPLLIVTIPDSVPISLTNTVITLVEADNCYMVLSGTQNQANYTYLDDFEECEICQDQLPPPANSWKVESCTTVGDFQYVPNNTSPFLSPGLVVSVIVNGQRNCYTVIEEVPDQATYVVDMVYDNCTTCENDTGEYVYFVEDCNNNFGDYATSNDPNIAVGTIMKYIEDGTQIEICVTVGQHGDFGSSGILVPFATYATCNDCLGLSPEQYCTEITATGFSSASGTYILDGTTRFWSAGAQQLIVICAELNSISVDTGTASIQERINDKCTGQSRCSIPQPDPICYEYLFGNDGDQDTYYTYTACDGVIETGGLAPGGTFTDCARTDPAPTIGFGGTIQQLPNICQT